MRILRYAAMAACLTASALGIAQTAEAPVPATADPAESISADVLLKQAMETSPDILSAKNTLAQAELTYAQTLPFKGSNISIKANGGNSSEFTKGTGLDVSGDGSLSVSVPILPNFSMGASLGVSTTAVVSGAGSVSWAPLATNQTAKDAKTNYLLARASYAQALRDARQTASAQIIGFVDARNALASVRESLALANISLLSAQAKEGMGASSATSLLMARKNKANAERSVTKAENALNKARSALALEIGGDPGNKVADGADVSLAGLDQAEDWTAPAFSALPKTRAVLKAEADLEKAKNSMNAWTDATSAKSNGPLSLSASLDTSLKFSLTGNLSLDISQIDGSNAKSKRLSIAAAQLALDQAVFQAQTEYQDAVNAAQDALLSLKDAEYQQQIDSQSAEAAKLKMAAQSMTELDYRTVLNTEKDSEASVASARLTLAKARAWFVTE